MWNSNKKRCIWFAGWTPGLYFRAGKSTSLILMTRTIDRWKAEAVKVTATREARSQISWGMTVLTGSTNDGRVEFWQLVSKYYSPPPFIAYINLIFLDFTLKCDYSKKYIELHNNNFMAIIMRTKTVVRSVNWSTKFSQWLLS